MNKFNWIETGNHNRKADVTNNQIEFHNRTKKNIDTDNMNEANITETNNNEMYKKKCSKKLQTQQRDFSRQQHISQALSSHTAGARFQASAAPLYTY